MVFGVIARTDGVTHETLLRRGSGGQAHETHEKENLPEKRERLHGLVCAGFELLSSMMLARREEFMATKSTKARE
jgi:hypothetical protein